MSNLERLSEIAPTPIWGGVIARAIHGERLTLGVVELAPDAVVPEHRHDNEQLGLLIQGTLTFTVGDETRELGPGGTWRIPGNVPHTCVAGPDGAVALDVFAPGRADWRDVDGGEMTPPVWPSWGVPSAPSRCERRSCRRARSPGSGADACADRPAHVR